MPSPDQIDDAAYALRREAQERTAANLAKDPAVRDAHLAMAERYADRAWSLREAAGPRT